MGDFRINYGNGQVSGTFSSYEAAKRALLTEKFVNRDQYVDYFYIEEWDGDWMRVPGARGKPQLRANAEDELSRSNYRAHHRRRDQRRSRRRR